MINIQYTHCLGDRVSPALSNFPRGKSRYQRKQRSPNIWVVTVTWHNYAHDARFNHVLSARYIGLALGQTDKATKKFVLDLLYITSHWIVSDECWQSSTVTLDVWQVARMARYESGASYRGTVSRSSELTLKETPSPLSSWIWTGLSSGFVYWI
jgi:hypothetical protein